MSPTPSPRSTTGGPWSSKRRLSSRMARTSSTRTREPSSFAETPRSGTIGSMPYRTFFRAISGSPRMFSSMGTRTRMTSSAPAASPASTRNRELSCGGMRSFRTTTALAWRSGSSTGPRSSTGRRTSTTTLAIRPHSTTTWTGTSGVPSLYLAAR
ncbi:unnamed protein product [Ectocarpus fasciculatus]